MGNIVRTDQSILGVGQWNWSVYSLRARWNSSPSHRNHPSPEGSKGPSTPTGTVFNGTDDFVVSGNGTSGPAIFIFVTEDGTISGWNPGVNLMGAIRVVDNSGLSAVYKGLASAQTSRGNFLYATNFHDGVVEMYNSHFQLVKTFTDINVPPGFAPFNIRNINGKLYVTFAEQQENKKDDLAGPHHGFVDVFDTSGNKLRRLISGGVLNSPWGLALAPANFGRFSNDLLVGNFGDGRISAFNPVTGAFVGQLLNKNGAVLSIDGLWMITLAIRPPRLMPFSSPRESMAKRMDCSAGCSLNELVSLVE